MTSAGITRSALALAALLAALTLVAARQGKGDRLMSEVELLDARLGMEQAQEDELVSGIRRLESRGVVETRAEQELGMHIPVGPELRFYEGGTL